MREHGVAPANLSIATLPYAVLHSTLVTENQDLSLRQSHEVLSEELALNAGHGVHVKFPALGLNEPLGQLSQVPVKVWLNWPGPHVLALLKPTSEAATTAACQRTLRDRGTRAAFFDWQPIVRR